MCAHHALATHGAALSRDVKHRCVYECSLYTSEGGISNIPPRFYASLTRGRYVALGWATHVDVLQQVMHHKQAHAKNNEFITVCSHETGWLHGNPKPTGCGMHTPPNLTSQLPAHQVMCADWPRLKTRSFQSKAQQLSDM